MSSMFDLLIQLPLFQGVSRESMEHIVGGAKFHFLKFPEGETILRAGDACSHVTFVISGSVRSTVVNASGSFAVGQTLRAPAVLALDFLFGKLTTYPATVIALEPTGILSLTTGEVDERIAFWITALTQKGGENIVLTCRSRDLCSLFNTPRSIFFAALESMKERGLLDYSNTELRIRDRRAMLGLLHYSTEPPA